MKITCTLKEKEFLIDVLSKQDVECPFPGIECYPIDDCPNCKDCLKNRIEWEIE